MIFHLVNDEKVINRTIDIFESVFPGENLFIVFREYEFSHVRKGNNIISYKNYKLVENFFTPSSVIIHLMTNRKIKFVNKYIGSTIPIYWVMWGSDLYDRLLMPKGYKLIDEKSSYYKSNKLIRFLKSVVKVPNDQARILRRISFIKKRVKYLVTSTIEDDYDIISAYYPSLREKIFKGFSYYPIDVVIGKSMDGITVSGNNIQIGNSGTHSNNHEYVFRILSTLDLKDREIIVPLSYSGEKKYKQCLIQKGYEIFGVRLKPITQFMPLTDYTNLMAECSVAIYGNWRQEAVGNIMVSLYLGAKVFISNKNPILSWASRHGFVVFELECISQEVLDSPLEQIDKEKNRNVLLQQFDSKTLYESMKLIFEER